MKRERERERESVIIYHMHALLLPRVCKSVRVGVGVACVFVLTP